MSDLLALEWGEEAVGGLAAHVSPGRVRVLKEFVCQRTADADLADPAKAGAWLKTELERLDIKTTQVAITLPRDATIIRRLELPDAPEGEWPLLVRFQASAKWSIPLDELSLDFLPLPRGAEGGVPVLAATVPRKTLDGLRDMCTAAGLKLMSVGLSAVTAGELLARGPAGDAPPEGANLLIVRSARRTLIALYQRNALLFAHSVRISESDDPADAGSTVAAEFARALVAARNQYPKLPIEQAWLLGPIDAPLAEAVRKRLQCELQSFKPGAGIEWTIDEPADTALFAGPLGSLLSASGSKAPTLDFLSPRQPPPPSNAQRKRAILLGSGAAAAAILVLVGYFVHLQKLSGKITALEKEDAQLKQLLDRGQPTMKSARAVEDWIDGQVAWLDELRELQDNFPGNDRLYLTGLRCEPQAGNVRGRIKFEGFSRDRDDVMAWNNNLIEEHDHYRVKPHDTSRTTQDSQFPWHFESELMLMPETKAPPKPAPAAKVAAPSQRPGDNAVPSAKQKGAT
ncbi:MAG TPA: hypothetical protein VHB77_07385 [Planctomycetaceae bacterium]|nr:hypothetical protein [Planctomycetaceae bacterium]